MGVSKHIVSVGVLTMAVGAGAQTVAASAVAELALKDGKTHFRSGEPIELEVTYRPGMDGVGNAGCEQGRRDAADAERPVPFR
jgi:hypothetical protein